MRLMPAARIRGEVIVPGDKSISHRALVLAAMGDAESRIEGRAPGADQASMVEALRKLGVQVDTGDRATLVRGVGLRGFRAPADEVDCGNSGTTMRLLTGAVAGIDGVSVALTGDESLSRRPMGRVAAPLRRMGADIETAAGGLPPVLVAGAHLHGAEHKLEVASAQVKTAILLAGLNADGETTITAPPSRDHTERMLHRLGVYVDIGETIRLLPPERLAGFEMVVPGDPSAAAFWAVLAVAHPDAEVVIRNVCLNPSRVGFLAVLGRMGAHVEMFDTREVAGEAVADLLVRSAGLHGTEVEAAEVPSLIDEVPALAVAAAVAAGETVFRGLDELRHKEVDRLAAIAEQLGRLGAGVVLEGDDLHITGAAGLTGAQVSSGGDHRMAMSLAVAATIAMGPSELQGAGAAEVSYPEFYEQLTTLAD